MHILFQISFPILALVTMTLNVCTVCMFACRTLVCIISLTAYSPHVMYKHGPYIIFCFFHLFDLSSYSSHCVHSRRRIVSLSQESRWTVNALCLSVIHITCRSVTWVCHRAWEPKTSHFNPHYGPPISLVGQHLPRLQPTAAWRSSPQGHWEKHWRGRTAPDLTHATPLGKSKPVAAISTAPICCLNVGQ